jgi:hypothetical protein
MRSDLTVGVETQALIDPVNGRVSLMFIRSRVDPFTSDWFAEKP